MLLDTDILVDLLRGDKEAKDFLYSLPGDSPRCCSTITIAEIHSGMREGERQLTTELIESLIVFPVTREIAEMAGKFRREYILEKRHGRKARPSESPERLREFDLELDDCLIAATAAVEGLELATRNTRHYPMPGVRVRPALY